MAMTNKKAKIFLVQEASRISSDASIGNSKDQDSHDHFRLSSNGLYGILTLIILILAPFSITLLPVHNALFEPFYWYELMYSSFSFFLFSTFCVILGVKETLNPFKKLSLKLIIDLLVASKGSEMLALCLMHLFWSDVFGYLEPFPFRQTASAYLGLVALFARVWNLIPKDQRLDPVMRTKCKTYMGGALWTTFATMQLVVIATVFENTSKNYQWLISLIVPLTKEINDRILDKLISRCASPENVVHAKFVGRISINVAYSFWLAITLATIATDATGYILLGINFSIDMSLCYKAIKFGRKVSTEVSNTVKWQSLKTEVLTELILNETVEIFIPIAFIGSVSLAYFGPNKTKLWGVGCKSHKPRIEDILAFFIPVMKMALLDCGSVIVSGLSLWWYCRINIWREYCIRIKKYWIHLAVWGGGFICAVSSLRIDYETNFLLIT